MNKTLKGALIVVLSAAAYGIMPVFSKMAYSAGINIPTLLTIRFLTAALILMLYCAAGKFKLLLSLKDYFKLYILGGIIYVSISFFYYVAIAEMPGQYATLILYVYPVIIAIISLLRGKYRGSRIKALGKIGKVSKVSKISKIGRLLGYGQRENIGMKDEKAAMRTDRMGSIVMKDEKAVIASRRKADYIRTRI